ncbi:MAG: Fe-S protein assembly co-chaperone HscB [Planctomycetota bacterium]|nr:Fe-S protein assembly co-chaperone HscB [Planctomycetota bacterium]
MNHVPAPDAFAVFGVPRALDLDANELELRYLQLSRECHPDHHRSEDVGESVAVLQRAAQVNDAWNVLKDRWKRARALLEAEAPGVLEANKKLDPMFLADALELAEEVAFADRDRAAARTAQLRAAVEEDFDALQRAVADQDYAAAARRVHQSHYHQKALADVEALS